MHYQTVFDFDVSEAQRDRLRDSWFNCLMMTDIRNLRFKEKYNHTYVGFSWPDVIKLFEPVVAEEVPEFALEEVAVWHEVKAPTYPASEVKKWQTIEVKKWQTIDTATAYFQLGVITPGEYRMILDHNDQIRNGVWGYKRGQQISFPFDRQRV